MNTVKTFVNATLGTVRTINVDGTYYFVGKDVTKILGYANASKALADHVDEEDKLNNESLSSLGQRGGWLINEPGLYSLIMSSKLPSAKAFKRWVTSEVLPAIRQNGGYIDGQEYVPAEEKAKLEAEVREMHAMCNSYKYQNKRLNEKVDHLAKVIERDTTGDLERFQKPRKKKGNAWDNVDVYDIDPDDMDEFAEEVFNLSEYTLMTEIKAIVKDAKGQYIDNAAVRHLTSEIDRLFIERNV